MKIFSWIIVLIVLIIGVSFALLNANMVAFHYYIGSRQIPLSLLLVFSFGLGLILGILVMSFKVISLKTKHSRAKRQIKSMEKTRAGEESAKSD